jgi:hypothetical protein
MAHEVWEQREIAQADRQIQAIEKVSEQLLKQRRQRVFLERTALGLALLFSLIVVGLSMYTDGRVMDTFVRALQSLESEDQRPSASAVLNCRHPRNRNTPYCQERLRDVESTWMHTVRTGSGVSYQYTLHEREPNYKKKR